MPPSGEFLEEIYYPAPRAKEDGLSWVFSSWPCLASHQPLVQANQAGSQYRAMEWTKEKAEVRKTWIIVKDTKACAGVRVLPQIFSQKKDSVKPPQLELSLITLQKKR